MRWVQLVGGESDLARLPFSVRRSATAACFWLCLEAILRADRGDLDLDRQLLDACGDRHLAGLGGIENVNPASTGKREAVT
jgi:hypothetical protein